MSADEIIELLSRHRTIGNAPREELAWIAAHGTLRSYKPGEMVSKQTEVVDGLYILFSGRMSHHVDRGAGRRKVMEWVGGEVTGLLPYSRMTTPPGDTIVDEPAEAFRIPREEFPALIRNCYEVTASLVHVMTDRARRFTSTDLRDEKLISLGKLASGLAHELNNPASAAMRSAKSLDGALGGAEVASRELAGANLTPQQLSELDTVRALFLDATKQPYRSGLVLADREEAFSQWLEDHDVDGVPPEDLARTHVTTEVLDRLARTLRGDSLGAALRWLVGGANARLLASDIDRAATRMHSLVSSVKGFTHMDRAPVAEPVDFLRGLGDTVAMLDGKARGKSVTITLDVAPNLPVIRGVGGEINQIWMNLIDNAIDAAPEKGRVNVTAAKEGTSVVVRVIDDGGGIPADIRESIFDPFFTTKQVGSGTGLGLDIVRRIVQWHGGEIEFDSRPGRTEFRVKLPTRRGVDLQ